MYNPRFLSKWDFKLGFVKVVICYFFLSLLETLFN